ncbi:MAG TPA: ClpXP protease specificity-enhancing factor SspB [Vineibacter sp.]|nr:ClpXP protease specificity-enhancing factor SspB [Vineibacter sp.]
MSDKFQYEGLVDEALRGVVRHVLTHTAKHGLAGAHHFYISFRTSEPGVEMPDYLRAKYPDDMTIVLQHQYWGLEVTDETFEVTVSFNKRNERLKVPFAALSAFVDPSVRFGLQFEKRGAATPSLPAPEKRPALTGPAQAGADSKPRPEPAAPPTPSEDTAAPADAKDGGAKVVTLDAFRKKP